ncbi:MetQ/NlpA family ABC transporter substrate-binding protein [Nesterenkonia sp. LY-0111]|uniref:MetQ/NlpA family ABC transporter substrate-binding protein n=2 Tax=Nesterenkonia aerolata TaxID=3074079 RepID=A0ABU2DR73_9MICC|nr:MetQ/NlpA family ABC transporter substrate-binding protein [Nesterenkonia sp. LY-0111]
MRPYGAGAAAILMSVSLVGCGLSDAAGGEDRTITMIVTESAPFQEPTELVKEQLEEDGWTLETTYVTDIIQPNQAVAQGEYDANFFQNLSYLDQFNDDHGLDVETTFAVYEAPGGIYSEDYDSLEDLPSGAQIAIPVDTANNGRALKLLADAGLLEIDESVEVSELSQGDIVENPQNLEFVEVDQQSVAQSLSDVDAAFAFVRLAAEIGLDADDAVVLEGDDVALPFTCVVAANPDFQGTEKAEALQEAFQSQEVQDWFDDYQGGVLDTAFDVDIDEAWTEVQG